ncbi:hypothetical protein FMEXI_9024 [Fusarium mexicanum]|uniref:Uncharacterized protein n=1 Tax=Fusarium mexicanum TaxID=751941 RepID=A0A8H5IM19_9HYPO|nr:hypothetical protein FMEXI_9024 [Fusarium mexicanum]
MTGLNIDCIILANIGCILLTMLAKLTDFNSGYLVLAMLAKMTGINIGYLILTMLARLTDLSIGHIILATVAKLTRNITNEILWLFKTRSVLHLLNGDPRHGVHDKRAEGLVGGVADEMAAGFANGSGAG